jgi:dihydropteroate synthase
MASNALRADQGVRVLVADGPDAVLRELRRTGCSDEGARIMLPKGSVRLVHLRAVPAPAATLLKQEMLSAGGDAAIHWEVISCGVDATDVVLVGTEGQLGTACAKLRRAPFGLPATGEAILDTLWRYADGEYSLHCGPHTLVLGQKTYIMGILNATPDSFSGDGLAGNLDALVRQAEAMLADGADILDVGGESTRPGAEEVPLAEELRRVLPTVRALAPLGVPVSVDTYKSTVAGEALAAGATIVNDISGLRFDPAMAGVAAAAGVPVVIMHIKGTPRTMQKNPEYADLMGEVCAYLEESTALALAAGIPRDQVVLDPGFGFGKTVAHNLELIRRLRELRSYGQPVLMGTSRKSTIGTVLGGLPPEERLEGTAATVALSIQHGADIVRVHDVKAMARVARMTDAIVRGYE